MEHKCGPDLYSGAANIVSASSFTQVEGRQTPAVIAALALHAQPSLYTRNLGFTCTTLALHAQPSLYTRNLGSTRATLETLDRTGYKGLRTTGRQD